MLHSFLAEMRKQKLEPWLDHEGYIHLDYRPEEAYFNHLKANKLYTIQTPSKSLRLRRLLALSCKRWSTRQPDKIVLTG
jgi:hypothetical protein